MKEPNENHSTVHKSKGMYQKPHFIQQVAINIRVLLKGDFKMHNFDLSNRKTTFLPKLTSLMQIYCASTYI